MTDLLDKNAVRAAALALRATIPARRGGGFRGETSAARSPISPAPMTPRPFPSSGRSTAEMPTKPLLEALCAAGITTALPVTGKRGSRLVFRRWTPDTVLVPGRMGLLEAAARRRGDRARPAVRPARAPSTGVATVSATEPASTTVRWKIYGPASASSPLVSPMRHKKSSSSRARIMISPATMS